MDIRDIITAQKNDMPDFDPDQYREDRQAEKEGLIDRQYELIDELFNGSDTEYKAYLDMQLRLDESAGNTLLIMNAMPEAVETRLSGDWRKEGRWPSKGVTGIRVLKQRNGYLTPASVFDVTQTDGRRPYRTATQRPCSAEQLTQALAQIAKKHLVTIQTNSDGPNALYDHRYKRIELNMGVKQTDVELVQSLAFAVAHVVHAGKQRDYQPKDHVLAAYVASYMVCKQYGLDVSNYDFDNAAELLPEGPSLQELRGELDTTREMGKSLRGAIQNELALRQPRRAHSR